MNILGTFGLVITILGIGICLMTRDEREIGVMNMGIFFTLVGILLMFIFITLELT
jgi:hypothetical protein